MRSTGLVVFGGKIFSAFTGLIFIVMVARWLAPSQLGLWEVVIDLFTFASYPVGVVAYWAIRDVSRGKPVGKTAMVMGTALSGVGLVIYFAFAIPTHSALGTPLLPFLLGALLVPLGYWSAATSAIVQAYRPATAGYTVVASEAAKLLVAYPALYVYKTGIEGVMLALIVSYFIQSALGTYFVRGVLVGQIRVSEARRWASAAWLPAISYLPLVAGVADTYVASLAFGTEIAGIYQAAFTVASVVGYSSALAFSLYPLMLRGGDERLPAVTIEFSLLFSIPMAVGGIVLASPILFLLGSKYLPGSLELAILSVMFVFVTASYIVDQTLLGTEDVDAEGSRGFSKLVHSSLLFVPLVNIGSVAVYLGSMYAVLWFASRGYPQSVQVSLWAAAQLGTTLVFLVVKSIRARRYARLRPGLSVAYYATSAAVMGLVVSQLSGAFLDRSADTPVYGLQLSLIVGAGAVTYFGLVYALDKRFRSLARRVL
ncbi:MAG: hypothetical protein HY296_01730 [Thaumarchaeota archaeon]|nr:hypothetical protein [Nitrososphaerota archaeon]